jgi:hypothetical protein
MESEMSDLKMNETESEETFPEVLSDEALDREENGGTRFFTWLG